MLENMTYNGVLETVSSPFGLVLNFIYVFLGGIFGIYVIVFIVKLIMNFRIRTYMKEIKNELKYLRKEIKNLDVKINQITVNNQKLKNKEIKEQKKDKKEKA